MIKRPLLKPCDKDKFELVQDYEYFCEFCLVKISAGFKTNGANIPRLFWSIFPPNSPEYLSAALIHDYLCVQAHKNDDSYLDYKKADKVFNQALKELNVNEFKRKIFYFSVRTYHFFKYWMNE